MAESQGSKTYSIFAAVLMVVLISYGVWAQWPKPKVVEPPAVAAETR